MEPTAQEQAWRCMLDLFLAQRGRLIDVAHGLGLMPQQAMAIKHLDAERGLTMSQLAQRLHCDNSNVTGIADLQPTSSLTYATSRRTHRF